MFKEKSTKKRLHVSKNSKESSTLDAMHTSIIEKFVKSQEIKQNLLEELNYNFEIQSRIDSNLLIEEDKNELKVLWNSNVNIKDNIINIKEKIQNLEQQNNDVQYYEETGDILFQYYNLIQNENNNKNKTVPQSFPARTNHLKMKKTILEELFELQNFETDSNSNLIEIPPTNNDENVNQHDETDKGSLLNNYLSITNSDYVKSLNDYGDGEEYCKNCTDILTCMQQDALLICKSCGYQEPLLVEQNRPLLKQSKKDVNFHFSYKRINHFREWCNQVQGKESTDIPDEIFEKILNELKKEKIDTSIIEYKKMREILKKLKINKYYEHINYIIYRINGVQTPQFSVELEEQLTNMFKEIQAPFLKHVGKNRKNFLSYSYVLYKFCQLLEKKEYLKYFPLLRSRMKLVAQDEIWKNICMELKWKYIPSV
jgi:hypothetical protein